MKFILTVLAASILLTSGSAIAQRTEDLNLKDYQWKNRVLLVFSPNTYNGDFRSMNSMIKKHRSGFNERDLKVFFALQDYGASFKGTLIEDDKANELAREFGISDSEFVVLLIGKDGTEKLRSDETISSDELFEEIDEMPMRKLEMKDDGK